MTFRWLWLCALLLLLAVIHAGPGVSTTLVFGFIPVWYLWATLLGLLITATMIIFVPNEPFTDIPEKEAD